MGQVLRHLRLKWASGGFENRRQKGPRGVVFRAPGGPKWPPGGLLGPLGRQVGLDTVLERKKFVVGRRRPPSWGALGAVLGPSWRLCGSFVVVSPPPGGLFLELVEPLFTAPWRNPENLKNHCFFNVFLRFFEAPGLPKSTQMATKIDPGGVEQDGRQLKRPKVHARSSRSIKKHAKN